MLEFYIEISILILLLIDLIVTFCFLRKGKKEMPMWEKANNEIVMLLVIMITILLGFDYFDYQDIFLTAKHNRLGQWVYQLAFRQF